MNPITMKLVVDDLILQALREDITFEDVSTASVCPTARPATVELIAKAARRCGTWTWEAIGLSPGKRTVRRT